MESSSTASAAILLDATQALAANALPRPPTAAEMEAADRRRLEHDLRSAIETGSISVHYQPRICLRTGGVRGAEALARWRHRRRGLVPPGVFIPIAERNGLIGPLGGGVLASACEEAASWPDGTGVSVNVSPAQLAQGLLPGQVSEALARSGLPPHRLELELTESMLVDADIETLLVLSKLRDQGIGLALDDFGTGYASLATLRRLPFSKLKLDRSLIRCLPHDPEEAALARAIVAMGQALGLAVVVEGIETWAQHRFFRELGCDEGQSYLLGRPMPGAAFRALLDAPPVASTPAADASGGVSDAETPLGAG